MLHDPNSGAVAASARADRSVPRDRVELHPAARIPFRAYAAVGRALLVPASALPPVLVIRTRWRYLVVGNFESHLARAGLSDRVPVTRITEALSDEAVTRRAWAEVAWLVGHQIDARTGVTELADALEDMPPALRAEWFGGLDARGLARALGRRASRRGGDRA